jgi:lipopolysaccharide export system permease protein
MYVDDLAGKGLEFKVLMELLFQFSLVFVPTALPLGILLASLMTFGNMGENFELSALKSSGVSLQRIMRPLIILLVFISTASFFFANNVLPYSNRKAKTLMYDIQRKRPELNIQEGTFYNGIEGFSIKIGNKDPETNRLEKILIYDHRDQKGNSSVTYADSGYMRLTADETGLIFILYNGYSYNEINENSTTSERKYPFRSDWFREQSLFVELSGFDLDRSDMDLFRNNSSMLDIAELNLFIDSLNIRLETRRSSYIDEYTKTRLYSRQNYHREKDKNDSVKIAYNRFNVDSIFESANLNQRESAVSVAIKNARAGSKFVNEKNQTLHREKRGLRRYENEWHKKFTLAVACLVFFFIGAPLGAIIRKGGLGMPVVISVLFFVFYYVLSLTGEKFAKEGITDSFTGMWSATLILFPIGIFLTYKATTDSAIMNSESYSLFVKRIGRLISNLIKR